MANRAFAINTFTGGILEKLIQRRREDLRRQKGNPELLLSPVPLPLCKEIRRSSNQRVSAARKENGRRRSYGKSDHVMCQRIVKSSSSDPFRPWVLLS
jgi:hypothetical protein